MPSFVDDTPFLRSWLFGPGADADAHRAMIESGADAIIVDLEDFTPPALRARARAALPDVLGRARAAGQCPAVRINRLEDGGDVDLEAALAAGAAVICLPMAESAAQLLALDAAVAAGEARLGLVAGSIGLVPVCETALGVVEVRTIATASRRIGHALLGTEDLAADLGAERSRAGRELAHARDRFLLDARAAGIEPIDAPFTYADAAGAAEEAAASRALGYRCKALVRPDHASAVNAALTPGEAQVALARQQVSAFEAARARGEDRALVEGHWVEVPAYRAAQRLLALAERMRRR